MSMDMRKIVQSRSDLRTVSATPTISSHAARIVSLTRVTKTLNLRSGRSFGSLALGVEEMISLRTPCFFIASRMFCVPRVIGLPLESPRGPSKLTTASAPLTARSMAVWSVSSPCTIVRRSCLMLSLDGLRTNATTWLPAASACSTGSLPVPPVAPKMASFISPEAHSSSVSSENAF